MRYCLIIPGLHGGDRAAWSIAEQICAKVGLRGEPGWHFVVTTSQDRNTALNAIREAGDGDAKRSKGVIVDARVPEDMLIAIAMITAPGQQALCRLKHSNELAHGLIDAARAVERFQEMLNYRR